MDIEEVKTVDMLTADSVSILTQKFTEIAGHLEQVGQNHRRAYINSITGRQELQDNEPKEEVVIPVIARWGDTPTIEG